MIYKISCDCGRSVDAKPSDAGASLACACGSKVVVPPLSSLRAMVDDTGPDGAVESPGDGDAKGNAVFVAATLLVPAVLGIAYTPALILSGVLMFFVARIWFALQILREMTLPNALLVFFVPFMPTLFLFKRFDVAWKPFLLGVIGFVAINVGVASSAP